MSTSVLAFVAVGCDSGDDTSSGSTTVDATASTGPTTEAASAQSDTSSRPALPIAWCDELPDLADSLDFAGPQYSEFPNGFASGQALAYALQFPFYVAVWPRTNHDSWLIVGVAGGMQELQADLDLQYPGSRVLAMNITWDPYSLSVLNDRVAAEVQALAPEAKVDWSVATGLVTIQLAPDDVTAELATTLEQFTESNVCATLTG